LSDFLHAPYDHRNSLNLEKPSYLIDMNDNVKFSKGP
jgi:hypothetical protein